MIVTINNNNSDKYLNLFTEAYEYLKGLENGDYVNMDKDRFSSLAEYYGHMADFFENQKYKYVMLPLDEEVFKIDLNTRTITVPTSFNKCASVQTDQLAETIVFVTDRYFDYMDLANTEIYVQWTVPENKKLDIEEYNGATRVEMIDLETEPGKIKFAWPLNDKITAVPGTIKFSVRFFRVDDSNPNKLAYSLNTLESSIIIKEALQPKLNAGSTVEAPVSDDSFKKAILNSLFADDGVVPPVQPVFFEPGTDITADTMMEVDGVKIVSLNGDSITLRIQAVVADSGEISYKWYHQGQDGNYYDCENYPDFNLDGSIVEGSSVKFGSVKDEYVALAEPPAERIKNERYYVKMSDSDPVAYKLYTGVIPAPAGTKLYERYSTFTVPSILDSDEPITGKYQAAAWNNITLDSGKVLTTLYPSRSSECLLPGPSTIAFKAGADLKDGTILALVNADEELYQATLKVELEKDNYNPAISYEWRTSTIAEEDVESPDAEIIATTDVPSLDVSTPGWYNVRVVSELNREKKYQLSNTCKVTKSPEPPVVAVQEHKLVSIKDAPANFSVSASVANPDGINEKLLTDSYTYVWQILLPDTEKFITIPDVYTGVTGQGTNSLEVTNKIKTTSANFRCLVINNLNGEKAVFDHSGSYNGNDNLGTFESKAPYIYANDEDNFIFTIINY